jgi:hypothetical protein
MRFIAVLVVALMLTACQSSPSNASSPVPEAQPKEASNSSSGPEARSGETPETAVVIEAKSTMEGIPLEHAWIKSNLPSAKVEGQALVNGNGKVYDRFDVVLISGKKRGVYFDITSFFGKW